MENIVVQPFNQLVCSRANYLEGGQFIWKIQKKHINLMTALNFTLPVRTKFTLVNMHIYESLPDAINYVNVVYGTRNLRQVPTKILLTVTVGHNEPNPISPKPASVTHLMQEGSDRASNMKNEKTLRAQDGRCGLGYSQHFGLTDCTIYY